jgi:phytoene/squalene synthetase
MSLQREEFLRIFDTIDFQKIKDHPNILIAANFWEEDRYIAAKTCYKFMRSIDDLIDDYKASNNKIGPEERQEFLTNVSNWLKMIIASDGPDTVHKVLTDTIEKFRIPLWPLEAFAKSMVYDINNDGFPTLNSFLEYSQGASVAPASIFVHLNGLIRKNGSYEAPEFNVREIATPCAIFSYIVHIIRDFQKDQLNNLNYFADDQLVKNSLTRYELMKIAHGYPVSNNFRNLVKEYFSIADEYRLKTYEVIKEIRPLLEPRYQLSLEIIFDLYLMIFERIDILKGNFTTSELNPTPEETKKRVYETIHKFISETEKS